MLSCFYYIPEGCRLWRVRRMVRRTFGLYMPRRMILADIVERLSHTKLLRWSKTPDEHVPFLYEALGRKIRSSYGLEEKQNPFVEIDADNTITNQYAPEAVSTWVIEQLRLAGQEYDRTRLGVRDAA